MDKAIVPEEIKFALDDLKKLGYTKYHLINFVQIRKETPNEAKVLEDYFESNYENYLHAVLHGYKVDYEEKHEDGLEIDFNFGTPEKSKSKSNPIYLGKKQGHELSYFSISVDEAKWLRKKLKTFISELK